MEPHFGLPLTGYGWAEGLEPRPTLKAGPSIPTPSMTALSHTLDWPVTWHSRFLGNQAGVRLGGKLKWIILFLSVLAMDCGTQLPAMVPAVGRESVEDQT